jgi:hypothetical protein
VTDPTQASDPEHQPVVDDEGPGWLPAVVAAIVLMGIVFFISCPLLTIFLFQHRTEIAVRTLQGSYIDQIEQSLLDPTSKSAVVKEIEALIADLKRDRYENWQAAGIMERLQRLPVIQWGELQAVEAYLNKTANGDRQVDSLKQLARLRRAVDKGSLASFDFEQILQPVRRPDPTAATGSRLVQPLTQALVAQLVQRAREAADRAEIPDQDFDDIQIESIVRREIERGASEGNL